MSTLADRIKIATLSCGAWRPYRQHKAETAQERARHSTDAVSVRIKLTDCSELQSIVAHQEATGREHRRLTLPTPSADMRMLVAGREMEHAAAMCFATAKHAALVDNFMAVYPILCATAQNRLGALYEPDAWPDADIVKSKFRFSYRYLACPTGGAWDDWLEESVALAKAETRSRLKDALTHYAERLKNAQRLHDSVAGDLAEARALASDNDVCGQEFAQAVSDIAELPFDIGALRTDGAARQAAAARAESILAQFCGVQL